jgi:hypothetical protein
LSWFDVVVRPGIELGRSRETHSGERQCDT